MSSALDNRGQMWVLCVEKINQSSYRRYSESQVWEGKKMQNSDRELLNSWPLTWDMILFFMRSSQKPEVRAMFKAGNAEINHENHHGISCSSIQKNTVCTCNSGYTHFFLTADWLKSRVKWLPLASPNWWAPWTWSGSSSFAQTTC